jgi:hypothetical protein
MALPSHSFCPDPMSADVQQVAAVLHSCATCSSLARARICIVLVQFSTSTLIFIRERRKGRYVPASGTSDKICTGRDSDLIKPRHSPPIVCCINTSAIMMYESGSPLSCRRAKGRLISDAGVSFVWCAAGNKERGVRPQASNPIRLSSSNPACHRLSAHFPYQIKFSQ